MSARLSRVIQYTAFLTTICLGVGKLLEGGGRELDNISLLQFGRILFYLGFLIPIFGGLYYYIKKPHQDVN
jgi:hypothetical protein